MAGNEILGGNKAQLALLCSQGVNHSFTQLISTEAGHATYQADRKEKKSRIHHVVGNARL